MRMLDNMVFIIKGIELCQSYKGAMNDRFLAVLFDFYPEVSQNLVAKYHRFNSINYHLQNNHQCVIQHDDINYGEIIADNLDVLKKASETCRAISHDLEYLILIASHAAYTEKDDQKKDFSNNTLKRIIDILENTDTPRLSICTEALLCTTFWFTNYKQYQKLLINTYNSKNSGDSNTFRNMPVHIDRKKQTELNIVDDLLEQELASPVKGEKFRIPDVEKIQVTLSKKNIKKFRMYRLMKITRPILYSCFKDMTKDQIHSYVRNALFLSIKRYALYHREMIGYDAIMGFCADGLSPKDKDWAEIQRCLSHYDSITNAADTALTALLEQANVNGDAYAKTLLAGIQLISEIDASLQNGMESLLVAMYLPYNKLIEFECDTLWCMLAFYVDTQIIDWVDKTCVQSAFSVLISKNIAMKINSEYEKMSSEHKDFAFVSDIHFENYVIGEGARHALDTLQGDPRTKISNLLFNITYPQYAKYAQRHSGMPGYSALLASSSMLLSPDDTAYVESKKRLNQFDSILDAMITSASALLNQAESKGDAEAYLLLASTMGAHLAEEREERETANELLATAAFLDIQLFTNRIEFISASKYFHLYG